jgi:DNA invertase Pin-like site-specific DNA recombinase
MRISTDALVTDIEPAVNWIGGLIGAALDTRVAGFERQERRNPLLAAHFRENFALEFALVRARQYRKSTGRLPKNQEYDHLYGFLIPAHRIYGTLPAVAKKPFEGRLRDAVNGTYGARPFAYEISIATHLMHKGWDVDFVDYSGVARFDFLARQGGAEIEIECKTTSNDTGRKIHRQEVNRLADLLLQVRQQLAEHRGCHRILITVPDRLGKSNLELSSIASMVSATVNHGGASSDLVSVNYTFEALDSWPEPDRDPEAARAFFEERFGLRNSHLLFHGRSGFSVVAVMITSAKADSVVDTIDSLMVFGCEYPLRKSGREMTVVGYARVSTNGQDYNGQIGELEAAGCNRIYREKVSGAKADRIELAKLLDALGPGDVLIVTRLDRLARSTLDLLSILKRIAAVGAKFKSLKDPWADTTTPHGELMVTILAGLATFEGHLIKARTDEGRMRAKARGVRFGRPPKLTPFQRKEALQRLADGESQADVARAYNIDPAAICRLAASGFD